MDITSTATEWHEERTIESDTPIEPLSLWGRIATFFGIMIPFAGVIAAGVLIWGNGFNWLDFALMTGMYVLTAGSVTIGFHRLFVHRSYETSMPVKFLLAVTGSFALQGSLMKWVALHRRHHQHSDTPDDVHSPHHSGTGVIGFLRGFWHSHIGFAFLADPPNLERYVKDLNASPTLRLAERLYILWVLLGLAIPFALGGLISGTWAGAWTGLIWGGLVRIFLVHHVTWSVNSACHIWGKRRYRSRDESRDNIVFGILALGEGWHNSHHAFPTSARHGLLWWQLDVSYWMIRLLAILGLAKKVKVPSKQHMKLERVHSRSSV